MAPAQASKVIVHPEVQVESLTKAHLRRLFSMQQVVWPNGESVIVYVLPKDDKVHKQFLKNDLRLFHYQLERSWNKLTFSGMGQRPIVVSSLVEMAEKVSQTPGAVGYISDSYRSDGVKEVSVDKG